MAGGDGLNIRKVSVRLAEGAAGAQDGFPVESQVTAPAGAAGAVASLALTCAFGLLLVAASNQLALTSPHASTVVYWGGMLTILIPPTWRITRGTASRGVVLAAVVLLAVTFFAVKVFASPLMFTLHDELGHWRSTSDILRTGSLFHDNPIVGYYPYYPGLDILTAALASLGLSGIHLAGLAVGVAARIVLAVFLYLSIEAFDASPRAAGLGCIVYMANPNFVYFDSQFSHESLALGIGMLVLYVLLRRQKGRLPRGVGAVLASLALAALAITHHATAFGVAALLLVWVVLSAVTLVDTRARRYDPPGPVWLTVAAWAFPLAWLFRVASVAIIQLKPVLASAYASVSAWLLGQAPAKVLFESGAGVVQPLAERALGIGSVGLALLALLVTLRFAWRYHRGRVIVLTVVLGALLYPASLALRFTNAGTEISSRSSEYVFYPLAVLSALFIDGRWTRWGTRGRWPAIGRAAVVAYLAVMVLGGIVVGWPPYARTVGPYLVSADSRSVSAEESCRRSVGKRASAPATASAGGPDECVVDGGDRPSRSARRRHRRCVGLDGVPVPHRGADRAGRIGWGQDPLPRGRQAHDARPAVHRPVLRARRAVDRRSTDPARSARQIRRPPGSRPHLRQPRHNHL